ncbi:MAG: catalase [Clostridia bacterium]|nr:catalase [Clostridia bacterium]
METARPEEQQKQEYGNHPFKHFAVVTRHRHAVLRHCVLAGIPWRGLVHDLSKYSPQEFIPSAKHFVGTRSPNEMERQEYGYSLAWMHHKGRNRHHFEYWTDYNPKTKAMSPVKMPLRFLVEMFCDRVGACKIYKGKDYSDASALEYFERGKAKDRMHPETAALLKKLLVMLRDEGEKKTFRYIRKELLKNKDY